MAGTCAAVLLLTTVWGEAGASGSEDAVNTGLMLINEGRYAEARGAIALLLDKEPESGRGQFLLALSYHAEDRAGQAKALFEQAMQFAPKVDRYKLYYGMCLYKLGELDTSRTVLEDYLERNPRDSNALLGVGLIDFDRDQVESAHDYLSKAVECAPTPAKQGRARKHLADVLVRMGELEAARDQLRRSVQLNPADDRAYHRLAHVLQRLGDGQGAAEARAMVKTLREGAAETAGAAPE